MAYSCVAPSIPTYPDPWTSVNVNEYATFEAAIAALGSNTSTLLIPDVTTVSASTTVPANVTLWFLGDGQLSIASAQTVTINGPIQAPPRQIFAGSGTVVFTSNTTLLSLYPQWWGAVGDGVTDDTTAIQAAIDAIPANGGVLVIPVGSYVISQTVLIQDRQNIILSGLGLVPGATPAIKFIWNGTAGGTVIFFDSSRDCRLENVYITSGTASFGVGIDIDRVSGSVQTPTGIELTHVSIGVPTNGTAIRTANVYKSNVDLCLFEDVTLQADNGHTSTNTTGYSFNSYNSHGHRIVRGTIGYMTTGVAFNSGGAANFHATNFSHNITSTYFAVAGKAVIYDSVNEEVDGTNADVFISMAGQSQASQPITIINSRLSGGGNTALNRPYIAQLSRGALVLIGNDFADGVYNPAFSVRVDGQGIGANMIAIGNTFANSHPFLPNMGYASISDGTGYFSANMFATGNMGIGVDLALHPLDNYFGAFGWYNTVPTFLDKLRDTGNVTFATAATALVQLGTSVGTITADSGTDTITLTSHGLDNGTLVHFANSGGGLPGGLSATSVYYVIAKTTNTLQLSATMGGSAVDITSNGTGTNTMYRNSQLDTSYQVLATGNANETFYTSSKNKTNFTMNSSNASSTATVDWVLIR